MGSFSDDVAGVGELQVDAENLDNISGYLSTLVSAIYNDLVPQLDQAHRLATVGGDVDAATIGAGLRSALGTGYTEVQDLARREASIYQAVHDGLRSSAQTLHQAAQAVAKMAATYRTAEERNGLNAVAFTDA